MHVRTTFLNGDLEKKVYMELEGFIVNGQKKQSL